MWIQILYKSPFEAGVFHMYWISTPTIKDCICSYNILGRWCSQYSKCSNKWESPCQVGEMTRLSLRMGSNLSSPTDLGRQEEEPQPRQWANKIEVWRAGVEKAKIHPSFQESEKQRRGEILSELQGYLIATLQLRQVSTYAWTISKDSNHM